MRRKDLSRATFQFAAARFRRAQITESALIKLVPARRGRNDARFRRIGDAELAVDIRDAARRFSHELQGGMGQAHAFNPGSAPVENDAALLGSLVEHV